MFIGISCDLKAIEILYRFPDNVIQFPNLIQNPKNLDKTHLCMLLLLLFRIIGLTGLTERARE